MKEWLKQNQHVTTVTRDRASAYAKAVEEVLPDCMQIADRFHLHQNLMDAMHVYFFMIVFQEQISKVFVIS